MTEELAQGPKVLHERRVMRLKSWLIATSLVVIGLGMTMAYEKWLAGSPGIWSTVVHHLSTALLIAGIWHAIEVFLVREDFFEALHETMKRTSDPLRDGQRNTDTLIGNLNGQVLELSTPLIKGQRRTDSLINNLKDQVHASRHEHQLGFVRSYAESHPQIYEEIIARSEELTLVLNNGYVWIHSHRDELKERLADTTKYTRLIVLSPNSELSSIMEAKEQLSKGGYEQRIRESCQMLGTLTGPESRLDVHGVNLPIAQAIFMSETKVLVVPRFTIEPSVPPVFEFEKNGHRRSYYKRIADDVEHLLRHPETQPIEIPRNGGGARATNGHAGNGHTSTPLGEGQVLPGGSVHQV